MRRILLILSLLLINVIGYTETCDLKWIFGVSIEDLTGSYINLNNSNDIIIKLPENVKIKAEHWINDGEQGECELPNKITEVHIKGKAFKKMFTKDDYVLEGKYQTLGLDYNDRKYENKFIKIISDEGDFIKDDSEVIGKGLDLGPDEYFKISKNIITIMDVDDYRHWYSNYTSDYLNYKQEYVQDELEEIDNSIDNLEIERLIEEELRKRND